MVKINLGTYAKDFRAEAKGISERIAAAGFYPLFRGDNNSNIIAGKTSDGSFHIGPETGEVTWQHLGSYLTYNTGIANGKVITFNFYPNYIELDLWENKNSLSIRLYSKGSAIPEEIRFSEELFGNLKYREVRFPVDEFLELLKKYEGRWKDERKRISHF